MDPLQEYLSRFGVLKVKTGSQKIDSSHLALTMLCPSWVRWARDRAVVHFNSSVQLRQAFHASYVMGAKQQPGEAGRAFCRGGKTKVRAWRGSNLPNKANRQLSKEGTLSFDTYLVSVLLVGVLLAAQPELRTSL